MPRCAFVVAACLAALTACHEASTPDVDVEVDTDGVAADTEDSDATVVDSEVDTLPADPVQLVVVIDPTQPAFDDDLHCTFSTADVDGEATVAWFVFDEPWTGTVTDSARVGDTIPHFEQAGGQAWRCAVEVRDADRVLAVGQSRTVTVHAPVPMVRVEPGTYDYRQRYPVPGTFGEFTYERHTYEITYPFLVGIYEARVGDSRRFLAYDRPGYWGSDDNAPITGTFLWQLLALADALSRADGLDGCYNCNEDGSTCALPDDPIACEGYRLPTRSEWEYVAREGGAHDDDLPAGGRFRIPDDAPGNYDPALTGPRALPGEVVSDQCVVADQRSKEAHLITTAIPSVTPPTARATQSNRGILPPCMPRA